MLPPRISMMIVHIALAVARVLAAAVSAGPNPRTSSPLRSISMMVVMLIGQHTVIAIALVLAAEVSAGPNRRIWST